LISNKEQLNLADLVTRLRKEKGLSQRKFAQISGLSNTTISRIENGETVHPDIETLKLLAVHLNYPEAKLLSLTKLHKNHKSKKQAKLKFLQKPIKVIKRYSSVITPIQEVEAVQVQKYQQSQSLTFLHNPNDFDTAEAERKISLKGMRLITLRLERNITQKELADALSIDKTLISQYEGEIIKPDYYTIQNLADFFGVTIEYLTGEPIVEMTSNVAQKEPITTKNILTDLKRKDLRPEYLTIAEELQGAGIEVEDVRAFIDMIRKYKGIKNI